MKCIFLKNQWTTFITWTGGKDKTGTWVFSQRNTSGHLKCSLLASLTSRSLSMIHLSSNMAANISLCDSLLVFCYNSVNDDHIYFNHLSEFDLTCSYYDKELKQLYCKKREKQRRQRKISRPQILEWISCSLFIINTRNFRTKHRMNFYY